MSIMNSWWCSCGAEFGNEKNAVQHVHTWHATVAEKMDFAKFARRVKILVYGLSGALEIEE